MSLTQQRHILLTCAALLVIGVIKLTECAFLCLYCNDDTSLQSYEQVSLSDGAILMDSVCYHVDRPNHFHVAGYDNERNGPAIVAILSAFISTKKYNVFLMDWEKEAAAIISINPLTKAISYVISGIPQAINVGIQFGKALLQMATCGGLDLLQTLITAHSLGAPLVHRTCVTVQDCNFIIKRVIALDAAGPGFGTYALPTLAASDAVAVMSVLTDPGELGINETLGTANILVNYETFTNFFTLPNSPDRQQPGCQNSSCSHNICIKMMVETIMNPNSTQPLLACKATDVWSWKRGQAICSDYILLGPEWDITKTGNFFMSTNAAPPYGQGMAGCCPRP